MNFPMMSKQAKRRVTSAELAGGLNLRDGPSQCMDNQLTDMVNMWYKNGALRTRPGMKTFENFKVDYSKDPDFKGYPIFKKFDITKSEYGKHWKLCCVSVLILKECNFFWMSGDELQQLPTLHTEYLQNISFAVQYKNTIYVYLNNPCEVYKMEDGADKWAKISEKEVYVPTVYTHCSVERDGDFYGTNYESYNLLGSKYKIYYSTMNPYILDESEGEFVRHEMYYSFPELKVQNADEYIGKEITATITDAMGVKTTHTLKFTESYLNGNGEKVVIGHEEKINKDGLIMDATLSGISFFNDENFTELAYVYYSDIFIENNLEITIPYIPTDEEKRKVFNMTKSIWFGGTSSGLENGTRIFLCGNTNESEKSLVCWSALNNPLYFPSENNAYVGDSMEAVICFGKQSDKLIIFKENETWYTQYKLNSTIDSNNLIYQDIIDMQSQGVYFPMVLINGHIGCDCSDTVQLCRNRLVWAHSNGNVYSLVSESNYTERSIYVVSEMISNILKKEFSSLEGKAMQYATSVDWEGYYVLAFQNRAYLMDYNSYGYTNVYSYSKTEDANLRIPWYYWEFSTSEEHTEESSEVLFPIEIFVVGNDLIVKEQLKNNAMAFYCVSNHNGEDELFQYMGESTGYEINKNKIKIKNYMTTKLFDFGEPNSFKNVCSVGLSLGYNGGNEITVTFVTDGGEEQASIFLEDEAKERAADFIKSVILSPSIRAVVRFGVRLECEGLMIADGLTMDYRITGRAR